MKLAKTVANKYAKSSFNKASDAIYNKEVVAIIKKAKEFDIPILENEEFVNMLLNLDLNFKSNDKICKNLSEIFSWLRECEVKGTASR